MWSTGLITGPVLTEPHAQRTLERHHYSHSEVEPDWLVAGGDRPIPTFVDVPERFVLIGSGCRQNGWNRNEPGP